MTGHFQRKWKQNGEIETLTEQQLREALEGNYSNIDNVIKYLKEGHNTSAPTLGAYYSYIPDCPETKENKVV